MCMKLCRAAAAVAILAAVTASQASAQPGGDTNSIASGSYNDANNWDNGVPDETKDAQIEDNLSMTIADGDDATAFRVLVGQSSDGDMGTLTISGGTLNTDRVVSLGGFENAASLSGKGVFNQTGGDVFIGTFQPGVGFAGMSVGDEGTSEGEYNISGGTMNMPQVLQIAVGNNTIGTVNQSGGTIDAGEVEVGRHGRGFYTMTDGVLNQTNPVFPFNIGRNGNLDNCGGVNCGEGSLVQSGGTITAAADVRVGNGDFSEGVFTLSGDAVFTAEANLNVLSNQTLAATVPQNASGTLDIVGSGVSITVLGAFHANGAGAAGNPTNSSMINYTIDTGGVSTIDVAGTADVEAAVFDLIESVPVSVGTVFDLIESTSPILNAETATLGPNALGIYQLQTDGSGSILQAMKIPEPTAISLLGLALAVTGFKRNRIHA